MRLFAIVFFIVTAGAASAQSDGCAPLRPLPGSPYGYKARGDRCEGLFEARVRGDELQLLSLTIGPIASGNQPARQFRLHDILRVLNPSEEQIHVRARARAPNTYYQMDANIKGGGGLDWPVDDVLEPLQISASNLAVLAYRQPGPGTDSIFVPVKVESADSSGAEGIRRPIIAAIRLGVDVDWLKWRLAWGSCSGNPSREHLGAPGRVFHKQTVDVRVPIDTANEGRLACLTFWAARSRTGEPTDELRLHAEVPRQ